VRDSARLEAEIHQFVAFLELEGGGVSQPAVLADLVRFQVFLLSTMDHLERWKTCDSRYAWKRFLLDGCPRLGDLEELPTEYSWENKVTIADPIQWRYKAVWLGRTQGNYKCHLAALHERARSVAAAC
jgi:hypothetical protein